MLPLLPPLPPFPLRCVWCEGSGVCLPHTTICTTTCAVRAVGARLGGFGQRAQQLGLRSDRRVCR
jgi:hypothetical protein